ncbi:MAG: PmoA family protein [Armatimonadetes bacterium]|nr:PmoA family protein [Armatimonadota bacterium]
MSEAIEIASGAHPRRSCPLTVPWRASTAQPVRLVEKGYDLIGQIVTIDNRSVLYFVLPKSRAEETVQLQVEKVADVSPGVEIKRCDDHIEMRLNGRLVTSYWLNGPARPYFYPLIGPDGVSMTRHFPMRQDVPGEVHDHPHHRSLYCAYGNVNEVDNWSEETGHGYTRHQHLEWVEEGPAYGGFAATADWADAGGKPLLQERLEAGLWNTGEDLVLLDFGIQFKAAYGAVHFGDTKEGGMVAIRVATSMDVNHGGRIENCYGGINEAETWGKAAHWCDYSGLVDGCHGGIAVMDHPLSFRYPTHWHVRDYGLMAANPFAYSAYTNGLKDGSFLVRRGEVLKFRYRLVLHRGDAQHGGAREQYLNYVSPPNVHLL